MVTVLTGNDVTVVSTPDTIILSRGSQRLRFAKSELGELIDELDSIYEENAK